MKYVSFSLLLAFFALAAQVSKAQSQTSLPLDELHRKSMACMEAAEREGASYFGVVQICATIRAGECPSMDEYMNDYQTQSGRYETRTVPGLEEAQNCDAKDDEKACNKKEFQAVSLAWSEFIRRTLGGICRDPNYTLISQTLTNRVDKMSEQIKGLTTPPPPPAAYGESGIYPYAL